MYRYSNGQISLSDFKQPVGMNLKESNRWVKKAQTIPWPEIEKRYAALFTNRKGNVAKPLRLALGACIIQAEYGYSDEETALQIQENPYLQYFCGYPGYDDEKLPFDPSLIWLLAKMPEKKIVGDAVEPYLCFTNAHDGSSGVRVCMTPVRVVCNNTLNMALATAKRTWSMRHTENVHERLSEARDCLFRAGDYMDGLEQYADMAVRKTLGDDEIRDILNALFPVTEKTTEREKATIDKIKDEFMVCYFAPDIMKFRGTAWGAINAISDLVTHSMPHRNTRNYQENNWNKIMSGHVLMDRMAALCMR